MLHREREIVGAGTLSSLLVSNHSACVALAWRRWVSAVHNDRMASAAEAASLARTQHLAQLEAVAQDAVSQAADYKIATAVRVISAFTHRKLGAAFRKWQRGAIVSCHLDSQRLAGARLVRAAFARLTGRHVARAFNRWCATLRATDKVYSGLRKSAYLLARSERDAVRSRFYLWHSKVAEMADAELKACEHQAQANKESAALAQQAEQQESAARLLRVRHVISLMDRRIKLDVQRALFRLRSNVQQVAAEGSQKSRAARRCVLQMMQIRKHLCRQAFLTWRRQTSADHHAEQKARESMRRLVGFFSGTTRENVRVAFLRWQENAKAASYMENERALAARIGRRVLLRLLRRTQAEAFDKWKTVVLNANHVQTGLHKVAYLLARTEQDHLRARLHLWRVNAAQASAAIVATQRQQQARDEAEQLQAMAMAAHESAIAAEEAAQYREKVLNVVRLMDRRCKLDLQRAWFRLHSNALSHRGLDKRKHHSLHRCVHRMQRHGLEMQRSALSRWRSTAAALKAAEVHAEDVLRGLIGLSAGSTRDCVRVAFGRWKQTATAMGQQLSNARSGVALAQSLLRRWEAGKVSRAFHKWRSETTSAHKSADAIRSGFLLTRSLLHRWQSKTKARAFRTWQQHSADSARRDDHKHLLQGLVATRLAKRVSSNLQAAWRIWTRQIQRAVDAEQRRNRFDARQALAQVHLKRHTALACFQAWASIVARRVATKKLLRKWLIARPVRRMFQRWRIGSDKKYTAVLKLSGLARVLQARASRSLLSALHHWRHVVTLDGQAVAQQQHRDDQRRRFVLHVLARSHDALLLPAWYRWKSAVAAQASEGAAQALARAQRDDNRRRFVLDVLVRSREVLLRPAWDRWKHFLATSKAAFSYRFKLQSLAQRLEGISGSSMNLQKWTGQRIHTLARRAALSDVLSHWKTLVRRRWQQNRNELLGHFHESQLEVSWHSFRMTALARRQLLQQVFCLWKARHFQLLAQRAEQAEQASNTLRQRAETEVATATAAAAAARAEAHAERAHTQAAARELQQKMLQRLDDLQVARGREERRLTIRILTTALFRGFQQLYQRRLSWALSRWHSAAFLGVVRDRSEAQHARDGLAAFVRQLGEEMASTRATSSGPLLLGDMHDDGLHATRDVFDIGTRSPQQSLGTFLSSTAQDDGVLAFVRDLRDDMAATSHSFGRGESAAPSTVKKISQQQQYQQQQQHGASSHLVSQGPKTPVDHLMEWDQAVQRHGASAAFVSLPRVAGRARHTSAQEPVPMEVSLVHSPPQQMAHAGSQVEHVNDAHRPRLSSEELSSPVPANPLDLLDDIDDEMQKLLGTAEERRRGLANHLGHLHESYVDNMAREQSGNQLYQSSPLASSSISGQVAETAATV